MVCKTMGTIGRSPISSRHPQTGLSPTIQGPSQAVQNTLHSQRIQQNRQRQCLVEFYTRPGQKRHRGSKQTTQSRILQSTVLSSQTREQMETRDRPQLPKPVSNGLKIQDGNPRINPHSPSIKKGNLVSAYVSPIPDPQAWAVDALNISWKNMISYAFPPTAQLPRVVQKLLSQECRLILIAPGWPTKSWFWDLVELSLDLPRQLPPIRSLLKQPLNNQFHTHPESLNLHAWYLGVSSSKTKVFSAEVAQNCCTSMTLY